MKFQQWEPDLVTLVSRMDADEIDLQPDFQRQEVWPIPKRRKLIDSILREWSMPPIHLIDNRNGILEVLDGQQRLAAIRDFVHGKISVDGTVAPRNPVIMALDGLYYSQLPPDVRRRIDRYTVRAFRISDFLPEEPSELFYRLNQPTLLTAGEQRNSLYGAARSQLKDLVAHFRDENSKEDIGFSNVRLAYDDVIARLLYFLTVQTIAVKATEGQISDLFRSEEGFTASVLQNAQSAIQQFGRARAEVGKLKLNKASLLSWLLFYARGEEHPSKAEFLGYFESISGAVRTSGLVSDARELFIDRASGRVTNISSVFLRDFCLWFSYVITYNKDAFSPYATQCCRLVEDAYEDDGFPYLEGDIDRIASIEIWSELS